MINLCLVVGTNALGEVPKLAAHEIEDALASGSRRFQSLRGNAHAAEESLERLAEVGIDGLERFGEFLAADLVDFLDGLLGIADGIDQVLALGAEEIVALLFNLMSRRRVRPAEVFVPPTVTLRAST